MATLTDLTNAIDALLNHPLGANHFHLMSAVEEKAYEAYIFGLCLRAARELGATVTLHGITGPANPFVFRGAPGYIYSHSQNYGYARFVLGGEDFEVHAGVEFCGTSGMMHELDVGILRASEAQSCRTGNTHPIAASLVAGWECKFFAGTLDKGLGRAFVGLMDDMGSNPRLSGLCSNATHSQLREYFKPQRRPYPHLNLAPLIVANEELFVGEIKIELKKMTGI